ncbi:MAG: hypothetical protein HOM14_02465 [Gammaproteobacteria bacterium]|jgi:hypothetical protein|nr:hypothetical protein [Gammaproteobacteria bacterium]MBT3724757.1 hypothetical protein [Gammaproteobacteria bacterium]MBT4195494.1 hypothetical protein [Gammaproteobacteria bacterium]MBT4448784.1 hypothetical protein [Gammaproteobacteria bacterium]MBT4860636.1 hypothetical protein [Gammaproteobacteria bacterium]
MDFENFLNRAWNDHAENTSRVAGELYKGVELIIKEDQIAQMSQIVTHVFGEHLGNWKEGIDLLGKIRAIPVCSSIGKAAIKRAIAVLKMASGENVNVDDFTRSEQIRIYALTASVLCGQNKIDTAKKYMQMAIEQAEIEILDNDPVNRVLAITGNNLACSFEEKKSRTTEETEMMILAAKTARKYWAIAGTWLEVERAEYRLAMTFIKANELIQALEHAQACIEICENNNAEPIEYFYGYEVLALVEKYSSNESGFNKALGKVLSYFEKLSDDDKPWCEPDLQKLESLKFKNYVQ